MIKWETRTIAGMFMRQVNELRIVCGHVFTKEAESNCLADAANDSLAWLHDAPIMTRGEFTVDS